MKKLASAFVIALALSTMATATDMALYIGGWDPGGAWYNDQQFAHVETIVAQTGHLFQSVEQFDDDHFEDFAAWIDENTNDGELDIIWLNGGTPSVLYAMSNAEPDGSRAEKWLDGGNMFINVGDWFGYVSYEGGVRQAENGTAGAANILDLADGVIGWDGADMVVTDTGGQYLPSLNDSASTWSQRPLILAEVKDPWEVVAIFASV